MPMGPGKYDDLCTYVREQVGITDQGGGVMLIVLGGNKGNGFSYSGDAFSMLVLPQILESVVRQMREDGV